MVTAHDLGFDISPMWRPNNILIDGMSLIFSDVPESVKVFARELRAAGWNFYSVDQRVGRCYYRHKIITIPKHAIMHKQITYKIWYISHEMAHAFNTFVTVNGAIRVYDSHGPHFMEQLIRICPPDCVKHELGYKPRNAKSAGIGENKPFNILDL